MKDRTFLWIFRGIGIGIGLLCAVFCAVYIYACYETAWGEIGMFFLPLVLGIPLINLECVLYAVKFFMRPSGSRANSVLKCFELALSGAALLCAVLAFVVGLGGFMGASILFTVTVPVLWFVELFVKRRI